MLPVQTHRDYGGVRTAYDADLARRAQSERAVPLAAENGRFERLGPLDASEKDHFRRAAEPLGRDLQQPPEAKQDAEELTGVYDDLQQPSAVNFRRAAPDFHKHDRGSHGNASRALQ
eukprot:125935-Rhodomonas_salina.3